MFSEFYSRLTTAFETLTRITTTCQSVSALHRCLLCCNDDDERKIQYYNVVGEPCTRCSTEQTECMILQKMTLLGTIGTRLRRRLRPVVVFSFICSILFLIYYLWTSENSLSEAEPQPSACVQLCPFHSNLTRDQLQFDSTHSIRHFPEFVCPQNFRNLADWIFRWPDQFNEKLEKTTDDGRQIAPCLPPGSIIYVRIWVMDEFFNTIYPHLINPFVLITGEGDLSAPNDIKHLERSDSKIIHWFSQNGQYDVSRSKKFTHVPIGINCYEMAEGIRGVYAQHSDHTLPPIFDEIDEPSKYIQPLDISRRVLNTSRSSNQTKEKLLLINFDKSTDRSGLRSRIWNDMCQVNNTASYVTCLGKPGGVQVSTIPAVYARNRQYAFWLSPRGNGLDCHRTWEALYLDVIPIVWNSSLNILYENLPVIIINDHRILTEKFLREKLKEITEKKLSQAGSTRIYHYEKLRNAYWRRQILSKSRHSSTNQIHRRQRQCWRANYKPP